jgi:hypothetical protein
MTRNPNIDPPSVKAWVKAQEGIMNVEDAIEDLRKSMSNDPGNPMFSAEDERRIKLLETLTKEAREIEKEIPPDQLDDLKSERDDERRRRNLKKQQSGKT